MTTAGSRERVGPCVNCLTLEQDLLAVFRKHAQHIQEHRDAPADARIVECAFDHDDLRDDFAILIDLIETIGNYHR